MTAFMMMMTPEGTEMVHFAENGRKIKMNWKEDPVTVAGERFSSLLGGVSLQVLVFGK